MKPVDRGLPSSRSTEEAGDAHFSPRAAERNISEKDWAVFQRLTSVKLNAEERLMAETPQRLDGEETEFLAVHWHPEWIPLGLIEKRLQKSFPAAVNSLAIPTQHNKVMVFGQWAGVEADVYDRAYGQKVQLLIHFRADRLAGAGTFINMVERTYNYRAHQLLDILRSLSEPEEAAPRILSSLSDQKMSPKKSITSEAVQMARFYAIRLRALIEMSGIQGSDRDEMLKNRLLTDFMQRRVKARQAALLEQALCFIKAVKKSVKAELSPEAFYSPQELIEEARSLGAGVVIPHPPLFWPILLSGLDVDGWEVWNPSTPDQAVFLTEALARANERPRKRKLLAFMGDDTHMSAKIRQTLGDKKAAGPEIGFQEAWRNPAVAGALQKARQSRANTINEYRNRLLNG